jgi:hypothetical protein
MNVNSRLVSCRCLLLLLLLLLLAVRRFWQQALGGLTLLDAVVLAFLAAINASWLSGMIMSEMKKMAAKAAARGLAQPTAVSMPDNAAATACSVCSNHWLQQKPVRFASAVALATCR